MEKNEIVEPLTKIMIDILNEAHLKKGDIFVLGCSTSEITGGKIGKNPSQEIGEWVVSTLMNLLSSQGICLAVQGCEHLNRALVVEKEVALKNQWEIVEVLPSLFAGGACSVAAFKYFKEPVEVEKVTAQAGIDIGDTFIGMHIKHVQVPIRPSIKELGNAHVTAVRSRPKFIGGPRASYRNG